MRLVVFSMAWCKGLSLHTSQVAHQVRAHPGFSSMKRLEVFLLRLDGMPVHHRVTHSIKFVGTNLYTWVERGAVRVKCLAQEHNMMFPARARIRTARSGGERTNHEATALPKHKEKYSVMFTFSSLFHYNVLFLG